MNRLPETMHELKNLLADTAELAVLKTLTELCLIKPYLKLREAKRLYGPAVVNRWIKEGLVKVLKDGDSSASIRISRVEIEAVAKSANRSSYLRTEERREL